MDEKFCFDRVYSAENIEELKKLTMKHRYSLNEFRRLRAKEVANLIATIDALRAAGEALLEVIYHANEGAWENGNTGPGGYPDEGEVLTFRIINEQALIIKGVAKS